MKEQATKNDRIYRFDMAKAILIVMVLVQHAFFSYFNINSSRDLTESARFLCLAFTMPTFAFLSGWFMKKRLDCAGTIKILFLCLVFNIIDNIFARGAGVRSSWFPLVIAPSLWYLWVLGLARLVVPLITHLPGFVFLSFLISWSVCFLPSHWGMVFSGRFFGFLPFFSLGCFVGNSHNMSLIRKRLIDHEEKWWFFKYLLPLTILYMVGFLFTARGMNYRLVHEGLGHMTFGGGIVGVAKRILFQSLACLMGFLFLKCLPNHPNRLSELGRRTLPVYLFHIWFVLIGLRYIKRFGWIDSALLRYTVMTVAFIFCLLLFHPVFTSIIANVSNIPLVVFKKLSHLFLEKQ